MALWIDEVETAAAAKVAEMLDLPMATEQYEIGSDGIFDPWGLFPALYGSYCSDFDKCALDVLTEIKDQTKVRHDLGAEMFREMLCTQHLCSYGTSPRVCFSTLQFRELLPALIEKWRAYSALQWGDNWDKETA